MGSDVLLKMWEDFWEHICDNQWALYGKYESMGWWEIFTDITIADHVHTAQIVALWPTEATDVDDIGEIKSLILHFRYILRKKGIP